MFVEVATELCVAFISFFRFFSSPSSFFLAWNFVFLCGIIGDTWVADFLATSFHGLGFIDVGKIVWYIFFYCDCSDLWCWKSSLLRY